jgi:hypothetical protein
MVMKTIVEDKRYNYFLQSRDLKEQTIKRYTRELTIYTESTGMTLEELIDEAKQDQENEPWLDNRRVPGHLFNHVKYMESKNYSPYRIKNGLNIVRIFYNQFQITLPKIKFQGEPESFYQKVDDLPNHQDI